LQRYYKSVFTIGILSCSIQGTERFTVSTELKAAAVEPGHKSEAFLPVRELTVEELECVSGAGKKSPPKPKPPVYSTSHGGKASPLLML
jgi:hypothetical protein